MTHLALLAAAAAVAVTVGVTVYAPIEQGLQEAKTASDAVVGGWVQPESSALTPEAQAAFDKAMEGLVGVSYKPLELLGTQVVAGTNYRILCEATVVYPGAEPYLAVVTIYQDLDGNASVLGISTPEE